MDDETGDWGAGTEKEEAICPVTCDSGFHDFTNQGGDSLSRAFWAP